MTDKVTFGTFSMIDIITRWTLELDLGEGLEVTTYSKG
jgi:hypothetical protein